MGQAIAILVAAALAQAAAPAGRILALDKASSRIGFEVVHKLHRVQGSSRAAEGRVVLQPDGTALVMVRVPVATFDSGEPSRDTNLRDTLEAGRFPFVTYKGRGRITPPASFPVTVEIPLEGVLEFHGRTNPENVKVQAVFDSPTRAKVVGAFDVSLDRYAVQRPSLLLVKVEDACRIGFELNFQEVAR